MSNAYLSAQNIKGKADAEATEIYANTYGKSPEFYNYLKTLETYKKTLDSTTLFILSTDNKYLKFIADSSYWIYLVHLPIVTLITFVMLPLNIFAEIKFILAIGLTSLFCLVSYKFNFSLVIRCTNKIILIPIEFALIIFLFLQQLCSFFVFQ